MSGDLNGRTPIEVTPEQRLSEEPITGWELDDTSDVSTTYYYYNSRDNKEVITKDKKKIDSILAKIKDSLREVSKDSIRNNK